MRDLNKVSGGYGRKTGQIKKQNPNNNQGYIKKLALKYNISSEGKEKHRNGSVSKGKRL